MFDPFSSLSEMSGSSSATSGVGGGDYHAGGGVHMNSNPDWQTLAVVVAVVLVALVAIKKG